MPPWTKRRRDETRFWRKRVPKFARSFSGYYHRNIRASWTGRPGRPKRSCSHHRPPSGPGRAWGLIALKPAWAPEAWERFSARRTPVLRGRWQSRPSAPAAHRRGLSCGSSARRAPLRRSTIPTLLPFTMSALWKDSRTLLWSGSRARRCARSWRRALYPYRRFSGSPRKF